MIDLTPAPVPELGDEWVAAHRQLLLSALPDARRHRPVAWAALAGSSAVAAAVTSVLLVGGSTENAFAGWSPDPTTPAPGQVGTAQADCQAALANVPTSVNKGADTTSFAPELTDVRGPYTVTVFGDGGTADALLCVTNGGGNTALRWIAPPPAVPVGAAAIAVDRVSYLARDSRPYSLIVGRTGSDVTGVVLNLADGTTVAATTGGGRFVAWWPGTQGVTSATVSTAGGSATQPLAVAGTTLPPPPKSGPSSGDSTSVPGSDVVHNP